MPLVIQIHGNLLRQVFIWVSEIRLSLDASHFDIQLLPGEDILWVGQPQKAAFDHEESRLGHLVIWFVMIWSLVYGSAAVWQHGLLYFRTHGGINVVALFFGLSLATKLAFMFASSSAGLYRYAITNKRIIAEMPDEGSQTTIVVALNDVRKVAFSYNKFCPEDNIGTITIATKTHREKRIYFRCICEVDSVYNSLTELI